MTLTKGAHVVGTTVDIDDGWQFTLAVQRSSDADGYVLNHRIFNLAYENRGKRLMNMDRLTCTPASSSGPFISFVSLPKLRMTITRSDTPTDSLATPYVDEKRSTIE